MAVATPDRRICIWLMPKTATSATRRFVHLHLCGANVCSQHDPAMWMLSLPGLTQGVPSILTHYGMTVDPWTWYARLWRHETGNGRKIRDRVKAFEQLDVGGPGTFRAWLRGATSPIEADLESISPKRYGLIWELRAGANRWVKRGLWSYVTKYMYTVWRPSVTPHGWGDTARILPVHYMGWLVDGLVDANALSPALGLALGVDPALVEAHGAHNTSVANEAGGRRRNPPLVEVVSDYSDWYDDEMKAWVAEADAQFTDALGYETPFAPSSTGPVIALGDHRTKRRELAKFVRERLATPGRCGR